MSQTIHTSVQTMTDNELISCILSSPEQKNTLFDILVSRHISALRTRCCYRLQSQDNTDDCVQETLLRAYRFLSGFSGRSSFRTWLFSIADNQCRELLRKNSRLFYTDAPDSFQATELTETSPAGPFERIEKQREMQQMLGAIPFPAREVLMLRYYADMPLQEISQLLGLTLSATKMRLYRGLDQLGDQYGKGETYDTC